MSDRASFKLRGIEFEARDRGKGHCLNGRTHEHRGKSSVPARVARSCKNGYRGRQRITVNAGK